ncbi:peptidase S8 [Mesorhizobium sp. NZP2234]|uniref:S8 family peptidase n=1 Tax=Mesorhizobium sp. NZP2234 TaxID=2483402 RepID=UPI0015519523|nr:S8 family serine peptidase [Mesorhizobium sp. NZP2234]QKC91801.1 peptidase S8 [Mesorhizobium sp. NZP2234]
MKKMKLEMVVLRSRAPRGLEAGLESTNPESVRRGSLDEVMDPQLIAARRPRAVAHGFEDVDVQVDEMSAGDRRRFSADPTVLSITPKMPVMLIAAFPTAKASPKAATVGWGIEAVAATTSPFSGDGVTVAVLDTGIDRTHPAFTGVDLVGRNFIGGAPDDVTDAEGHGTHCAGIIFGRDVDNCRIGVARGVKRALIGKVLGEGGGSSEQIVQAILWAQLEGANVLSMSLGMDFPGYQQLLMTKYHYAPAQATSLALAGYRLNTRLFDDLSRSMVDHDGLMAGQVVTAAAGNESHRPDYSIIVAPPATGERFLSVAALGRKKDKTFRVAPFSNEGATIAAPGEEIVSARTGGGLVAMSGTSMAAPHVAGVAALWVEKLRQGDQFTARNVIDKLKATALGLAPLSKQDVGQGLVQAPQMK